MILKQVFLSIYVKDSEIVMMDTSGDHHDPLHEDLLGAVRKRKHSNRAEDCGALMVKIINIKFHF